MASLTVLLRRFGKWNIESNYVDYSIEGILIKEYASYNDLGVYVELKKENREPGMYPLCITTIEKELVSGSSLIQGDIVQIDKSVQRYDSDTDDTLALDFVNSGQAIGVFELDKDLIISKTNQREVIARQIYKDKATLNEVMEHCAISQRFQFRVDRSNSVRFKASSINKSELFKVREFIDKHTCPLKDKVYEQRHASSNFIDGLIRPKLTNHKRKYTPKDIIDDVKSNLGVDVSYMLAWRAKEKAMNFLRGEPANSYKTLSGYLYTMDKTYLGSHVRMVKLPKNEFMYVYISLYTFIKGFGHCRPIVVMDGSHLKSYYTGTFVSANTLDGAASTVFNSYGVIDSESDAIWTWFFEQFKIAYGGRENMCIVSDRNESIIKYVSRVYPDVPHFACIWHLWNNIYKKFKKSHAKLSEIYFSMAKAYTQAEFDSLMEKVETVDIRVKEYLELAGYEHWARFYAHVNRGWTMTSNIVESISATLLSARELSIYDFLEEVRKMFGRWNCTNRKEATQTYTTLEKKYQEMLTLNEAMSTLMTLHTVTDRGRNYTVCLLERKCVCGRFQVDELPCPHAWAVLKSKFLMPEDYCSNYYKPNSVVMTYDVLVYSLPDRNEWNIPAHVAEEVVLPPKWKRPPGRPKKKRDKPFSELLQPKN
ncbi:uncharacterized protein [Nicotiana sylvestris]|uniref:uncharacterized protein n=1 Tax=Nicotiana sylvestris TaxID=4096 RepID=UPI00388C66A9